MDGEKYIRQVLPGALKCGNNMLGNNWTYQHDGAKPHIHHLRQKWCADHFPVFISKEHLPPDSSHFCLLDYSLWNELGQHKNKRNINRQNKTFCQKN